MYPRRSLSERRTCLPLRTDDSAAGLVVAWDWGWVTWKLVECDEFHNTGVEPLLPHFSCEVDWDVVFRAVFIERNAFHIPGSTSSMLLFARFGGLFAEDPIIGSRTRVVPDRPKWRTDARGGCSLQPWVGWMRIREWIAALDPYLPPPFLFHPDLSPPPPAPTKPLNISAPLTLDFPKNAP